MSNTTIDTNYQPFQTESISEAVVAAIARAKDVDPVDIETPLYEVVDPDALDSLFPSERVCVTSGLVEFSYCGYDVTVTSGGEVSLEKR